MKKLRLLFGFFAFAACTQTMHAGPRQEWFYNLSLESAVTGSDLIIAAQVVDVTEIKLMHGGKGESAVFQYKFKPARVLKGVFAREELSLGSSDLGIYREEDMKRIVPGAFMLIFLGRSDQGYHNNNRIESGGLAHSMPPIHDADDPLLDAVRVLMSVNAARDRVERVSRLIDGLNKADGPGAVALLEALQRRALVAAQNEDVTGAVTKHLGNPSAAVRIAAARTLRAIIEADYLEHASLRESAVNKSVEALKLADPNIFSRAAAIGVIGVAGTAATKNREAMRLIATNEPNQTHPSSAKEAAKWRAIGELRADAVGASPELLAAVYLDEDDDLVHGIEYAICRLHPDEAAVSLRARINGKISAGLDARAEIESFAELPAGKSVPALIELSTLALNDGEKAALAVTCLKLTEQDPDARLVKPLAGLLAPREPSREPAIDALLKIDTDEAAKALQPHLREEQNLFRKLQVAEMLGRHGIRDGYVFAIEHVSEPWLLEQAVAALAAIKEPQAVARLKEILETSNDLAWNTAAVRALGAMGAQDMAAKFLALADDLRNPLAPAALIALSDLGESKALDKAREGLASRNNRIVTASARTAGKLLALPGVNDDDLRNKLATLLADADADTASRTAALAALIELKDGRLDAALAKVVREAGLENSDLLRRAEKRLRERKVKL